MDKETGQEMEIVEQAPSLSGLPRSTGTLVPPSSSSRTVPREGNQFVKGFGGIGAILRYKVNFEQLADLTMTKTNSTTVCLVYFSDSGSITNFGQIDGVAPSQ